MQPTLYILHENPLWLEPIATALTRHQVPFEPWFLDDRVLDLQATPPHGVFFNKMSASAHTRGHRHAPDLAMGLLTWLEAHGKQVINGTRALQLEMSKAIQLQAMQRQQIAVPHTAVALGEAAARRCAAALDQPFIVKHNRGGKGLSVHLCEDGAALETYLRAPEYEPPVDGLLLIQEYVQAADRSITRMEFIGGRFHYAVRVDTSGGFELCPAEACQIPEPAATQEACMLEGGGGMFQLLPDFNGQENAAFIARHERLLASEGIEVAGMEFITTASGARVTYDINVSTNYNPEIEQAASEAALDRFALWCKGLLQQEEGRAASANSR